MNYITYIIIIYDTLIYVTKLIFIFILNTYNQ